MAADDTSREALVERVARVLDAEGAFCGECDNEPGGFYDECSQCRRFLTGYATAVVDAVALPLVQELDRWLAQVKAEAWDEGHCHAQRRGPDDCTCEAWSEDECACGQFGNGELGSLADNPYREQS